MSVDAASVPAGLHLVAGLTGFFSDAGSAVSQLGDTCSRPWTVREIAQFDLDALLDYRARRPPCTSTRIHLTDLQTGQAVPHLADDENRPALPVPNAVSSRDFQWERFTGGPVQLVGATTC
ncbi:MAG: hypothetical protein R2717_09135 [Schumannella sp.]